MNVVIKNKPGLCPDPSRPIISVGTVNVDQLMGPLPHWPEPGTETVYPEYEMRIGGGVGNFGAALMALDAHQHMVVNVGKDAMGDWLCDQFGDLARHWHRSDTVTSVTFGLTHPDKERTFLSNEGHSSLFDATMVRDMLRGIDVDHAFVMFVGSFLMPGLVPDCEALMAELSSKGAIIALDTAWPTGGWSVDVQDHLERWLRHVDVLLLNDAEVAGILGVSVDELASDLSTYLSHLADKLHDNAVIVIKRGAAGASAFAEGKLIHEPVPGPVDVVDTVGAGDCFNAGFLMALQHQADLQSALRAGIEVAGKAIASNPRTYPTLSDLRSEIAAILSADARSDEAIMTYDQVGNI